MLYVAVTTDRYELPIAVARSQSELARYLNTTPRAITSKLKMQGKYQRDYKVIRVPVS